MGNEYGVTHAIDLKVGMIYRRFASHDWATIKDISYNFRKGSISGVNIIDVDGGGCSIGAYATVQTEEDNRYGDR